MESSKNATTRLLKNKNALNMNVILICVDQMRADTIAALGNNQINTPNLDNLIRESFVFLNHYSAGSPCGPARTSLFTGQYPSTHGSFHKSRPLQSETNLALELKKHQIPSSLFGYTDTTYSTLSQQSEDIMSGFNVQTYMNLHEVGLQSWMKFLRKQNISVPKKAMDIYKLPILPYDSLNSDTAFLTDQAINFINNHQSFGFLHLAYFRPHPPFVAPNPFSNSYKDLVIKKPSTRLEDFISMHPLHHALFQNVYGQQFHGLHPRTIEKQLLAKFTSDQAEYYGLISELDLHIGRLIDCLKDKNLFDDTMFIFTSDHGELLGKNWLYEKGGYFDSSFHVPLIFKLPKSIKKRSPKIFTEPYTSSIDLMPTILTLLGISIPKNVQGQSFSNLMVESKNNHKYRTKICFENFDSIDKAHFNRSTVIKDNDYKYVHCSHYDDLFFDLHLDPSENQNLAKMPRYASLIDEYKNALKHEQLLPIEDCCKK
ncbi:sulfatase-like hydrolase/transferase [uncultured Shewanella sp.]|uniref:sulfatase-like hydrolase/transferase n=1 Tax=uncultured Shewanella sp. TaxID=173975 RepID=UPI002625241D|nr:sulfatase-like hydrolase/transferase [uncultured Shewanella sp.]